MPWQSEVYFVIDCTIFGVKELVQAKEPVNKTLCRKMCLHHD
jgi:hypothetical protein